MPIVQTPDVLSGKPRIEGHRIDVLSILSLFECGESVSEIVERSYPSLTEDEVHEALDWIRAHPGDVFTLRRDELVARERLHVETMKPPIRHYTNTNTFISMDVDKSAQTAFQPSSEFLRIYHDRFHESFTLYRIDMDAEDAQPLVDAPNHSLRDVLARAEDEEGVLGDTVLEERSVELNDFSCLQRE